MSQTELVSRLQNKYRVGELHRFDDYSGVFIITHVSEDGFSEVFMDLIRVKSGIFSRKTKLVLQDSTLKITDPKEKAYWLLRFENARNA